LKPFVDRSVNQGPIEVSLLGNITQQQAVDYVAQTFGALNIKAQDFVPRPRDDIQLNVGEHYTLYHQGEQNTALASGYFSLPDGRDYKRVVGLAVLRSILQLRVNDAIREKTGKAYSPWVDSSQSLLYKDYGYLSLNSNTTVDNVDVVFDIYRKLISDIQQTGVSSDELKRAVTPMIDGIEQSYENNGFWFGLMYKASSYPENLTNEQTFKQLASAVTVADVQQLAKQINLKDMITVAVLPKEKEE
jgi:zinc protease